MISLFITHKYFLQESKTLYLIADSGITLKQFIPLPLNRDKYPSLFEKPLPLNKDLISKEVNKHSHGDIKLLLEKLNVNKLTSMKKGLSDCYNYAIQKIDK